MTTENPKCPDTNVLTEFLDGTLQESEKQSVFTHVATCPDCHDACAFAAKVRAQSAAGKITGISEAEKEELRRKLSGSVPLCKPAAAGSTWQLFTQKLTEFFLQGDVEVVAASDTQAELVFSALPGTGSQHKWRMFLAIPTQISDTLEIRIQTAGTKTAEGKLIFCGNKLDVRNGKTKIRYNTLKNSFHNPEIAFCFLDGEIVAGSPEL